MIISHKHRLILIRQKKTAGTSIEQALIPFLGENDFHSYIETPKYFNYAHEGRQDIIRRFGQSFWDTYFKAATTRNPWDRAVSQWFYYYKRHGKAQPPFADYLRTKVYFDLIEYDTYMMDGQLAVDFVIRYEHLAQDLNYVCGRLGLPHLELDHYLGEYRKDRTPYQQYYNRATQMLVASDFAPEIALHGYRFEDG